jgi:hypothetical protein
VLDAADPVGESDIESATEAPHDLIVASRKEVGVATELVVFVGVEE